MSYAKLSDILRLSEKEQKEFWEVVCGEDVKERDVTKEESFETMRSMYLAMRNADTLYDADARSVSQLSGGDGAKLEAFRKSGNTLVGPFLAKVMEKAVKMAESNACMKRIVAAPTAGSCGVIPAVLLSFEEEEKRAEDDMVKALFVAAGIGEVIAESASIAGAEGGCQAEIGTASAMAAGALAYLLGGDNDCIVHAAALAIKNMLGLTCDPVAGLVEVPCVKRNVSGAVNAVSSAELAIAGVRSKVAPDDVIEVMRRTGNLIPSCLRETSQEGLALTPLANKVKQRMKDHPSK